MRPRSQIMKLGPSIPDGVTKQIICPFCEEDYEDQGHPIEWKPNKSMSVTHDGHSLLYNCFRAGCRDGRGAVSLIDGLPTTPLRLSPPKKKDFEPDRYLFRTRKASIDDFPPKLLITPKDIREQHIRFAIDRYTVVYPIFNQLGEEVGVVDRSYGGRSPKTLNYWFKDVPKMHFPLEAERSPAVLIVEDIPSAIRATPYVSSVALLGTNLTSDCLMTLKDMFKYLYIALDNDATIKAMKMAKQYSVFFDDIVALPLDKDIKNMTTAELAYKLGSI